MTMVRCSQIDATTRRRPTTAGIGTRVGLTLLELLVVIGIIGVVAALALPAVQAARGVSQRTQCQSNLHQIGVAFDMFLSSHGARTKFPDAATMPSVSPDRPSLAKILESYVEDDLRIFACPMDEIYSEREGLSYEYPAVMFANKTRTEVLRGGPFGPRASKDIAILWDFGPVHGAAADEGSRNFLFLDGHVDTETPTPTP